MHRPYLRWARSRLHDAGDGRRNAGSGYRSAAGTKDGRIGILDLWLRFSQYGKILSGMRGKKTVGGMDLWLWFSQYRQNSVLSAAQKDRKGAI